MDELVRYSSRIGGGSVRLGYSWDGIKLNERI